MNKDQLFIIPCPPLSSHPKAPEDQPGCEIIKCPHCDNEMWISRKKRALRDAAKDSTDHHLTCYLCLMEEVEDGLFRGADVRRIDI